VRDFYKGVVSPIGMIGVIIHIFIFAGALFIGTIEHKICDKLTFNPTNIVTLVPELTFYVNAKTACLITTPFGEVN
jgi:hypothetical protein